MEGDIDLKSKFSREIDFILSFKEEWVKVTNDLKKYIKEEQEDEEQCIQSKCEHSEVD